MNDVHLWAAGGLGLQDILRFELSDRRKQRAKPKKIKNLLIFQNEHQVRFLDNVSVRR